MYFSVLQFFLKQPWDTTVHFCLNWHLPLVSSVLLSSTCVFPLAQIILLILWTSLSEMDRWAWWYYYFSALRLSLPSVSSLRLTLTLTSGTALSMVANSHHQVRWLFLSSHSHWSFLIFDAQFWKSFLFWLGSFCTLPFLLVLILFQLFPLLCWLLFLFPPPESCHSPRSYSEFLSLISGHFFPNTVSSTSITSPNIFTHPKLWPYYFSWTSISSFNHHQDLSIWTYLVSFSINHNS